MTWREVVICLSKIGLSIVCVPLLIPKDPGDRVHIVAESLLPMMFLGLRKLGNICCEHILSVPDTKFVSATNVARGQTGKHLCRQQCVLVCQGLKRTSLLRFGGISGEFGRAMVRIWARRSRAKIPIARPKEPDMSPKRTKNVRLGIYRTQIHPKIQHSGQWLDIVGYQDSRIGSWLANCEFGYGKTKKLLSTQASNTSIWYS